MNKPHLPLLFGIILLLVVVSMISFGPGDRAVAQSGFSDPANEHACPSQTGAGGGAEAIPAFVDQAAMDSAPIRVYVCRSSRRFRAGRVRRRSSLEVQSPVTAWTRKVRSTWNSFEACPAG